MKKIKNIGPFAFQNEYGWMEAMSGKQWNDLMKTYKEDYNKYLKPVSSLATQFQSELMSQPSYTTPPRLDDIVYEMHGFQSLVWQVKNKEEKHSAADIDVDGSNVWAVEDRSDGAEQYTLCLYENGKEKWSYTKGVGPFVAVLGSRCYAIELENYLWLRRLVSVNKQTGLDKKVELDIKDPGWNLQLVKGVNGCLFIVANNAGAQRCWYRTKSGTCKELTGFEAFVPVGFTCDRSPSFFGRKPNSSVYEPVNCKVTVPSNQTPEFFDPSTGLLCTRSKGKRMLWKDGKHILTVVANIDIDTLGSWKGGEASITVQEPGSYRQDIHSYLLKETLCPYAKAVHLFAKSKDGTSVPLVLVSSCKPKHLLCIVYGAYGVPTRLNTDRWKPLLDRGWGLCFALVRGGGDDDDAWAEAGRRDQKIKSIEDFEACIRVAQKKCRVSAKQTLLYGRSAGGYTVGTTLSRNPFGSLFQGVYTEVPYVDVLNTTSNPDLPLTQLEYDEFGNPHRLVNAQALLSLSPIDTLPPTGAPSIFVLSRTALQDKEVYAYESVKWITRLAKGSQAPKLLAVEEKEGHFASYTTGTQQRAQDMAIFFSWFQTNKKSHGRIYPMANTRRNNMRKRRNNVSMRKRRNNVSMRKRRNNVSMGGKRRRSTTRRH